MKKLTLKLDALQVETFAPAESSAGRGTVLARQDTVFLCTGYTCDDSCYWSEVDCHTQECGTDFNTCMEYGSCCPAHCNSGEPW